MKKDACIRVWHVFKHIVTRNQAVAFPVTNKQPFPLPHYCGIGDIPKRYLTFPSSSSSRCIHVVPLCKVNWCDHQHACALNDFQSLHHCLACCSLILPVGGEFPCKRHVSPMKTELCYRLLFLVGPSSQCHCYCSPTVPLNSIWMTVVTSVAC